MKRLTHDIRRLIIVGPEAHSRTTYCVATEAWSAIDEIAGEGHLGFQAMHAKGWRGGR